MHRSASRLVALAAGIAAILSCDYSTPTGRFGSGISGGPTGTAPVAPASGPDTGGVFVVIDTPTTGQLVNVGDSILTVVRFTDDRKIQRLTITGFTESGDTALGTFTRTVRYTTVVAPAPGFPFQPGQIFARIRRFLQPAQPVDTTLGPMVIMAIGTDSAGNVDTNTVVVNMVAGPDVNIVSPANGDQVPRGIPMSVSARATHTNGVASLSIRVRGEATWPTLLDTTFSQTYPPGSRDVTLTGILTIPGDAIIGSRVTITASAVDVNGNPGNAPPITAFVREAGSVAPTVCFAVITDGTADCGVLPSKLEIDDDVLVKAEGDGITAVGIIIKDTLGVELRRDTVFLSAPFVSNVVQAVPLGYTDSLQRQGQRVDIIAFALDNNTPARIGFSIPTGTTTPISVEAAAFAARTLLTFGRTFAFPRLSAASTAGDLAVDVVRGNVYLSNTNFNLLELWNNGTKQFVPNGIPVGALPWGLFVQNGGDTLLVANSGATTVSKVCINPALCVPTFTGDSIGEALAKRIRTRNTTIFRVQFTRDPTTGKIILARLGDVSYSDRPQYIVQSAAGRVFFSTRPTDAATPGTLRWLDPTLAFPDPRQIWQYGNASGGGTQFAIFHADSIAIVTFGATSPRSDLLQIYDHAYGTNTDIPGNPAVDSLPADAATKVRLAGGDVEVVAGLDVASLALTDTTFVAASGDRVWIGFGEGNTPGTGRVIMSNDAVGCLSAPTFFPGPCFMSPTTTVSDLVDNASERVFGIAIDQNGLQVVAHGTQTYVAAVDNPFHLRLDGVYDSFDNGVGVAYHPLANSTLSANANRVLFTATNSGIIEIVDVAHYNSRGSLTTQANLYGPLRVSLPLSQDNAGLTCPGDARCVILKLYGLSSNGLVVIDLRAADIKPGP